MPIGSVWMLEPGAAGASSSKSSTRSCARARATPVFYTDYPKENAPLTRVHREHPQLAEKWDLVMFGSEQGTAYSELIDPLDQRERLVAQSLRAAAGDAEAMRVDEDFLQALEFGMPPTGGMGMGIDRLVMNLTGTGHPRHDPVPAGQADPRRRVRREVGAGPVAA